MLNKPVNDEFFNFLTIHDWNYYSAQFNLDQEEEVLNLRNAIEYHAMFINHEGVDHVKTARAQAELEKEFGENNIETQRFGDDEFAKFISRGTGKAPVFQKR